MLGTLCTLITALTCVSGVTVVTQKPPVVTVRKGDTASLDCNLGTVDNSAARWYKQVPGGVPQFVLYFYHGNSAPTYGSGFSSPKFTSDHQSKSDYRLIINTVEETDSAVYYCKTWDNSVKVHVFGPGTKLIVTDGDLATPAVTLFPPSTEDLKSSRATLVCLTSDLSQRSKGLADVSWMSSGESVTEDVSTSPAEQQPDNTFRISSYLTIQTADWDKDVVFTCKVSLGSTFSEKEIRKTSCSL
ncbi:immunoglobulin lambda-1 light chain-like [Oncorhynchus tshawytscha]|uniref:immunoglobulin lambda-1 light chain-like n=1 Tax=Oncorhynchus tshawytscha TaxID=74940 RepID=UPI001C3E17DC|nr:immunoglobulin lambda-1 light chain-like [Oncorhynchus tshawytscha]